jgi:hypothetical protein
MTEHEHNEVPDRSEAILPPRPQFIPSDELAERFAEIGASPVAIEAVGSAAPSTGGGLSGVPDTSAGA